METVLIRIDGGIMPVFPCEISNPLTLARGRRRMEENGVERR